MNKNDRTALQATPELEEAVFKVRSYLEALEARDVSLASSYLDENVAVIGPGGRPAGSAKEIVANSSRRYRKIGKHIARFDAMPTVDEKGIIVYCIGTLHGEWLDGREFSEIRFIDRFELLDGLIVLQEVWNDAAERKLLEI